MENIYVLTPIEVVLQQIYVMKSDGTNVKRITFGDGIYGTPVWSPRGDLIAFTKNEKKENFISV